jgi:hypothetical protein
MDGKRLRKLKDQNERNRRLKKLSAKQRAEISSTAVAAFECHTCRRKVTIAWGALCQDTPPKCAECGGPLNLKTACLNRGVLPRLDLPR